MKQFSQLLNTKFDQILEETQQSQKELEEKVNNINKPQQTSFEVYNKFESKFEQINEKIENLTQNLSEMSQKNDQLQENLFKENQEVFNYFEQKLANSQSQNRQSLQKEYKDQQNPSNSSNQQEIKQYFNDKLYELEKKIGEQIVLFQKQFKNCVQVDKFEEMSKNLTAVQQKFTSNLDEIDEKLKELFSKQSQDKQYCENFQYEIQRQIMQFQQEFELITNNMQDLNLSITQKLSDRKQEVNSPQKDYSNEKQLDQSPKEQPPSQIARFYSFGENEAEIRNSGQNLKDVIQNVNKGNYQPSQIPVLIPPQDYQKISQNQVQTSPRNPQQEQTNPQINVHYIDQSSKKGSFIENDDIGQRLSNNSFQNDNTSQSQIIQPERSSTGMTKNRSKKKIFDNDDKQEQMTKFPVKNPNTPYTQKQEDVRGSNDDFKVQYGSTDQKNDEKNDFETAQSRFSVEIHDSNQRQIADFMKNDSGIYTKDYKNFFDTNNTEKDDVDTNQFESSNHYYGQKDLPIIQEQTEKTENSQNLEQPIKDSQIQHRHSENPQQNSEKLTIEDLRHTETVFKDIKIENKITDKTSKPVNFKISQQFYDNDDEEEEYQYEEKKEIPVKEQIINSIRNSVRQSVRNSVRNPDQEEEIIYQLNEDGYLVDQNGNYITDDYGNLIVLSEEHIQYLKESNILEEFQE